MRKSWGTLSSQRFATDAVSVRGDEQILGRFAAIQGTISRTSRGQAPDALGATDAGVRKILTEMGQCPAW